MLEMLWSSLRRTMALTVDEREMLDLFEQIMPAERWQELAGAPSPAPIYTLRVVVAMMLLQRFNERGTQQEVVDQIAMGNLGHLLPGGERKRGEYISHNTGGYARARGRVSVSIREKVCDQALGELGQRIEPEPEGKVPVLLLEGTSISLEHASDVLKAYPPTRNPYGQAHWGRLRLVALHDVQTGMALRPRWGRMDGAGTVSEQELAQEAIQQAPAESVILGDGNLGIFSLAYAMDQSQHKLVFRLTKQRADALGARSLWPNGEMKISGKPTRKDREKNPHLPQEAKVEGRLLVVTRNGFRESLYLFTTLDEESEEVVALYGKRWNLELDLRTLKRTMRLYHLRVKSEAAVEKELLIAVVGYGLVRAVMALAARRVGLPPRRLSFTRSYSLLNAMLANLFLTTPEQREQQFDCILHHMAQTKLPNRSKPRAYPRAVWGFRQSFPPRRPEKAVAQCK